MTRPNLCSTHQVAHVLARDAAGGCHEADGLPVAAVEGEGHAHALAVVAADLQAVRAPAGVARVHGNAPLVPALLAAGVALEQEPMHLHDAVDPLHVRRGPALPLGLTTQESMNPSIAVGGQIGNERLDRGDKPSIRQRRATSTTRGGPLPRREVRARDAQGCGHRAHRPSPGHEVTRKGSFLGAVTRSTASRRISFSSVFLPSRRCSSRIC